MDWTRSIDPEGLHTRVLRDHEERMRRAELARLAETRPRRSWRTRVANVLRLSPAPVGRTAPIDP